MKTLDLTTIAANLLDSICASLELMDKKAGDNYPNKFNEKKDFTDPFVYDITSDKIDNLESIINGLKNGPTYKFVNTAQIHYMGGFNRINMLEKKYFNTVEDFYWVMIHETTHFTGDMPRLKRQIFRLPNFLISNDIRAFEELIAELSTRMIFEMTGNISDRLAEENHYYIRNMVYYFNKNQPIKTRTLLSMAMKQSVEAVNFILTNQKVEKLSMAGI